MIKTAVVLAGLGLAAAAWADGDKFSDFTVREMEEMRDLDAFENAAFEDVSKYGKSQDGHVEIGRFGFNGNGGARITPSPDQVYFYNLPLKKSVNLKKGQAYVLSADVRCHGKIGCQTCADVSFRKSCKYAFGIYGPASRKLGDGWVRHTREFVPKYDHEELDYTFRFYCRQSNDADFKTGENHVEVDNVAIHTSAPSWYFCNTWPTHNMIFSEAGRVRAHSAFVGPFLDAGADPVYAFRLRKPDGAEIVHKAVRADADGNMTAALGKLDYAGPAKLCVTLYDLAHKLNLGTREIDVTVAPTPDATKGLFVKENGIVLRNGKPYMPVGFYTNLADYKKYSKEQAEEEMRRMRDAGFDAMIDYGTYMLKEKERRDWYYGACEKFGIGVISDHCSPKVESGYSACLGYYTMDEAAESEIPRLTKSRRGLNAADPGKIVTICNIMRPFPYLPCADIQGGDSYPIKYGADLTGTYDYIKNMADCAPAAMWVAPQAYNWASMVPGALTNAALYAKSGREPKENETLSVALTMAALGVRGFFFYSYFDIFRCPIKERIPERWECVCKAGKCLRDLEPFIMSGEKPVDVPHADAKGRTLVRAFTDGKGAWRVIVIGIEKEHETTFALPAEYGKLKSRCGNVMCENGIYTFTGKGFSCDVME